MKERKYVKFRVDMYDDTKFKIIDMKPERDLIHYVWNRVVVLAGKVNLEGKLYLSKSIPYNIETLAIEFNRNIDSIILAFKVLMELEMIELTKDKVYKVKNFAKHQNIKVKEKNEALNDEENIKSKETEIKKDLNKEINNINEEKTDGNAIIKERENTKNQEIQEMEKKTVINLKVTDKDICKEKNNIGNSNEKDDLPVIFEDKRDNKIIKRKKKVISSDITHAEDENKDNSLFTISEGEYKLSPDERIVNMLSF